jgi:hypothetical protein
MAAKKTPNKTPAQDKLAAVGLDAILEKMRAGESGMEIADEIGVGVARLWDWLRSTPDRSARVDAAMLASAEGWVDRGLRTLLEADSDPTEIARARAIEQHCARRAAIRAPKTHGDKLEVDAKHSGGVMVTVAAAGDKDEAL